MKATVTIEIDMKTGEYSLEFGSDTGESIDQKELAAVLDKVVKSWNKKFQD